MDNKSIVTQAISQMFCDKDVAAVDRWIAPEYIQHNAFSPDGPNVVRKIVAHLDEGFRYEMHRAIADGSLVALHGTYYGIGPDPVVAFDIFRVENKQLAEHWDGFRRYAAHIASGRTQTDGPTEVTDLDRTDANRKLVVTFVENVLNDDDLSRMSDYVSTTRFHQHNPHIEDGIDGFITGMAALAGQGKKRVYEALHKVVAEGNFVLTLSEGRRGPVPTAFYDLFRVEDDRIVEHWDVNLAIPEQIPHSNGVF